VRLYPLYHPAAALYTPSTLEMLRADFQRIPDLLALGPPPQPEPVPELEEQPEPIPEPEEPPAAGEPEPAAQLGLF
jgi:DNA polymerase